MFLGRETLEEHSQLPKKANKYTALGRLQAFRMYGVIGMSASSLHRESTDALIYTSDHTAVLARPAHLCECAHSGKKMFASLLTLVLLAITTCSWNCSKLKNG